MQKLTNILLAALFILAVSTFFTESGQNPQRMVSSPVQSRINGNWTGRVTRNSEDVAIGANLEISHEGLNEVDCKPMTLIVKKKPLGLFTDRAPYMYYTLIQSE